MRKLGALVSVVTCVVFLACELAGQPVSDGSSTTTPLPSSSPTSTPPPSAIVSSGMQEAEYNGYPYSYKREGDRTVAMFVKRFLPRDDTIVVGAIRDVIRRAYKEETYGSPRLVDWDANGTATRAIRIDGSKNGYVVLPVKEDTGEIHSLSITRVAHD